MKNKNKVQSFIQLIIGIAIIILLNFVGNFVFHRFDLTAEKRYSLSPATKKLIKKLDDVVYFKIYLDGEFPSGFKRLRDETKEMLDEFRAYSGDNIQYTFINPSEDKDQEKTREVYEQLYKQGLQPSTIQVQAQNGEKTQVIFPGALVNYHDKSVPMQLLMSQVGVENDEVLNNSVENLEYQISSTIRKLTSKTNKRIAFIEGHGELGKKQVEDISNALGEYYSVERVRMDERILALRGFNAAIIAKPDSAFSEKDKFIIDQFIMKGGKVLWLIDPVFASMDSLTKNNVTMGIAQDLKLDDMLFRYGVRINTNLVQDVQGAPIPVFAGYVGNQPQQKFYPWYYFPVAFPASNHPLVKNLNAVKFEFASSIDTVGARNVQKIILLTTSKYTKLLNTPVRIDLSILKKEPNPQEFKNYFIPLAILLEGNFESVFNNRIPPEIENAKEIKFKSRSDKNSMIIVSDGDIIKNQIQASTGKVFPLGYDRYTKQEFGNKTFILNCMNYLLDDEGLITVRSRDVKLRLLDKTKITASKLNWQLINTIVPILIVMIYGIISMVIRKRRFAL